MFIYWFLSINEVIFLGCSEAEMIFLGCLKISWTDVSAECPPPLGSFRTNIKFWIYQNYSPLQNLERSIPIIS